MCFEKKLKIGALVKGLGALVKGQSYTVRVDTFNENGITEGTVYQTV